MARSKQRERFSETETSPTGRRQPLSKTSALTLTLSAMAVIWAAVMLTSPGQVTYAYTFYFLEFYAGVFTLLSLTATVVGGLLATDRIVMTIRYRVLLQTAHRMSGAAAILFLITHITIKVSAGAASIIDPFVPFVAATGNRAVYVGLGTIASYMMLSVFWTGIARARFAGNDKPWLWRALHSMAYLSWPVAIGHGLSAGRPAAGWVIASYLICVLLVSVALIVRMTVGKGPRATAGTTTGSIKAIGKPVAMAGEGRSFRQGAMSDMPPPPRGDLGDGDVLESRRGGAERDSRRGRDDEYGAPVPRRDAEPSRRWGPGPDEYSDERPRRSEFEPERSGRYMTEKIPVGDGRRRRSADETSEYAPPYADRDRRSDDEYAPRGRDRDGGNRSRRSVEEYAPPRGSEDYPVSGPPRHRHEEDEQPQETTRSRSARRRRGANPYESEADYEPSSYLPADDTPTLVDMAARRALRAARDSSAPPGRASRRKKPPEDTVDDRYWVS